MSGEKIGFERLRSAIPEGWQDKTKELGAFVRRGKIKTLSIYCGWYLYT
jgi:hypothetical protein